jgi:hypothetical protein
MWPLEMIRWNGGQNMLDGELNDGAMVSVTLRAFHKRKMFKNAGVDSCEGFCAHSTQKTSAKIQLF